ncbi:MAG: MFS transporter [Chloroflexi bacterium]|nr:MFS transporter [Chloroflexota bacterium]
MRQQFLIFGVAMLLTTNRGGIELGLPLAMKADGYDFVSIGSLFSIVGIAQLSSRIPAGGLYRGDRAPILIGAGLLLLACTSIGIAYLEAWPARVLMACAQGAALAVVTTCLLAALIEVRTGAANLGPTISWYTAAISSGYGLGAPLAATVADRFGYQAGVASAAAPAALAAVLALIIRVPPSARAEHQAREPAGSPWSVESLRRLPASVWLGALLMVYINAVNDAAEVFFPIYAVSIGISLPLIGLLRTVKSYSSTAIRFGYGFLMSTVGPRILNHVGVLMVSLSVLLIASTTNEALLLAAFVALGLCRGLVRVTTSTQVAEARNRPGVHLGLASSIYNGGLDLGFLAGPPITGALAGSLGIPAALTVVAVTLPALYYLVLAGVSLRRTRSACNDGSRTASISGASRVEPLEGTPEH